MSIPASQIVTVNPAVISSGGNPLALNGLFLTQNALMPVASVYAFTNPPAVKAFFGAASPEYALSLIYFAGFDTSTVKPGAMLFAPYNLSARAAFLQSGSLASLSLTQLQALSGASATGSIGATFTATGTGTSLVVTSVTGIITPGDVIAGTGVPMGTTIVSGPSAGGAGTYTTSGATTASGGTVTSFGTTLKVTAIASGTLSVGNLVTGTGVPANAAITAQISGTTGGVGVYTISVAASAYAASTTLTAGSVLTISLDGTPETSSMINLSSATSFSNAASIIAAAFGTAPVVTWNAVNNIFLFQSNTTGLTSSLTFAMGGLAAGLNLTQANGAILSAGAVADTPASAMASAVAASQNWATFTTMFEPSLSNKEAFTIWSNGQNNRYAYMGWDTDPQAIVQNSTTCFGAVIKAAAYNGVAAITGNVADIPVGFTLAGVLLNIAAFAMGTVASINFSATNGRTTLAFRSQSGLTPSMVNGTVNLIALANGYSYYGLYATANQNSPFFYNGQVPGEFEWLDTFVNQIFLNSQFQQVLLNLPMTVGAVNYNQPGYGLIRAAMLGPINGGLNFGSIRADVTLSAAQIAEVNSAAGLDAATQIQNNGYYLQILDPGATARGLRQSPIINFWYTDGGAVQQITLASIDIE